MGFRGQRYTHHMGKPLPLLCLELSVDRYQPVRRRTLGAARGPTKGPTAMSEIPRLERDVPNPADDQPGVLLRSPYSDDLTAALKEISPRSDRRWVPELEGWWAASDHEEEVVHAVLQVFGRILLIGRDGEDDRYVDRDGTTSTQERLF